MPIINLYGVQVSVSDQRVGMPMSRSKPSTSALTTITLHDLLALKSPLKSFMRDLMNDRVGMSAIER